MWKSKALSHILNGFLSICLNPKFSLQTLNSFINPSFKIYAISIATLFSQAHQGLLTFIYSADYAESWELIISSIFFNYVGFVVAYTNMFEWFVHVKFSV